MDLVIEFQHSKTGKTGLSIRDPPKRSARPSRYAGFQFILNSMVRLSLMDEEENDGVSDYEAALRLRPFLEEENFEKNWNRIQNHLFIFYSSLISSHFNLEPNS